MAITKKHVTLCQEGNKDVEYYPNIETENIPDLAVTKGKLAQAVQNDIDGKAPQSTTYTKSETDALLNEKANASSVYTKTETNTLLSGKANSSDVYTKTAVDLLLDDKADKSTTYTKTQVDDLLDAQELTLTGTSGLLTTIQKSSVSNGTIKRIIISDKYYTRNDYDLGTSNVIVNYTGALKSNIISSEYVQITHDVIAIDMSTGVWTLTSNVLINTYNKTQLDALLNGKQATLVSGTNIKTINNTSILGSGNIDTIPSYEEITITGTLTDGYIEFEYAPLSSGIYLIHNGTIKPTLIYINNNLPYNYEGSGTGAEYGDDTTINVLLSTSMLTLYNPTGSQFNLNENNFKIKRLL